MSDLHQLEHITAERLIASLANSQDAWGWRDGDFDIVRGPGGIQMSANYFTIFTPLRVRFGFWNRRRIKRAFKQWKASVGDELANSERHRALLVIRDCLVEPLRAAA